MIFVRQRTMCDHYHIVSSEHVDRDPDGVVNDLIRLAFCELDGDARVLPESLGDSPDGDDDEGDPS
jgi:hypothetical protein